MGGGKREDRAVVVVVVVVVGLLHLGSTCLLRSPWRL